MSEPTPKQSRAGFADAQAKGAQANAARADAFAANVLPIIRQIQASGIRGEQSIVDELNRLGVKTARGGAWGRATVRNVLARAR